MRGDQRPIHVDQDTSRKTQAVYAGATARVYLRSRAEGTRLFDGLEIIEPGVVHVSA